MKPLLLSLLAAILLPSCAGPSAGLNLEYNGQVGLVPYRLAYSGGKAVVSVQIRPSFQK
jgi:hypothetical protein